MFAKKEKKIDLCPKCSLESGIEQPLIYKPGARYFHYCDRGHEFQDREELASLMMAAQSERNPVATVIQDTKVEVAGTVEFPKGTKVETSATVEFPQEIVGLPDSAPDVQEGVTSPESGILVNAVDFVRLSQVLGHFTDSSSLFGAVFALQQQLADTRELLHRAETAKKLTEVRKVGGDALIQVIVPERHVGPIEDIAKANGMDMTRYMNARIEDGLDNMWFY